MSGNPPFAGETNIRRVVQAVRELFEGRSNAGGTVTLTANAASTTVAAINCGPESRPVLMPATANAAAEVGAGTIFVSAVSAESFVVTHANNAQTDRTFHWVALG